MTCARPLHCKTLLALALLLGATICLSALPLTPRGQGMIRTAHLLPLTEE